MDKFKIVTNRLLFKNNTIKVRKDDDTGSAAATLYFDGIDGAWTTVGNWWLDAGHTQAAGRLPTSADSVVASASIDASGQTVADFTLNSPGFAGNELNGELTVTGNATFNDNSVSYGTITGNATFNDGSSNDGTVTGNATFNDSSTNNGEVTGTVTCNTTGSCTPTGTAATVPGAPTITQAFSDLDTNINHTVPDDGGSAITGYKYYFNDVETAPDSTETFGEGIQSRFLDGLAGQEARVSAVNAIGEGPKSEPVVVESPF